MRSLYPKNKRLELVRRAPRGVTLIEIMIVVAIVGIVAAIAVPNFGPLLKRQKVVASAELAASVLDRARRKAFNSGRCVRVRLASNVFLIEMKTGSNGANCVDLTGATWGKRIGRVPASRHQLRLRHHLPSVGPHPRRRRRRRQ